MFGRSIRHPKECDLKLDSFDIKECVDAIFDREWIIRAIKEMVDCRGSTQLKAKIYEYLEKDAVNKNGIQIVDDLRKIASESRKTGLKDDIQEMLSGLPERRVIGEFTLYKYVVKNPENPLPLEGYLIDVAGGKPFKTSGMNVQFFTIFAHMFSKVPVYRVKDWKNLETRDDVLEFTYGVYASKIVKNILLEHLKSYGEIFESVYPYFLRKVDFICASIWKDGGYLDIDFFIQKIRELVKEASEVTENTIKEASSCKIPEKD